MIQHISAVTIAIRDMVRSVDFYKKLGFELLYGGESAAFSSLRAGQSFVNLVASPGYEHRWWGRAVFRVDHVDGHCWHKDWSLSRREMLPGASASFTSPTRTGTSLASRSYCRCEDNGEIFAGKTRPHAQPKV